MLEHSFYKKIIKQFFYFDVVLLICTFLLIIMGIFAIYSASSNGLNFLFIKQIIFYIVGTIFLFVVFNINYNFLIAISNYLYIFFIVILIVVLIIGKETMGAQRWLNFGWFQFQPSEFMKIIVPLTVIRFILIKQDEAYKIKNLLKIFIITLIPVILILKQPDLGTALLLFPVILVVLFIGNISIKKLITIIIVFSLLLPIGYFMLKDYQRQRLQVFLNPEIDKLGSGYNVIQSQIAVGSGKLFGKGWRLGTQSQLNFIPVKYTDFIFAVIAEEFGFFGSLIVIIIYFILIMECLKIIKLCRFTGGKMLGISITTIIFLQIFINIGMTIGIMPVTGITLPLLSYGGTSVIIIMISLGIMQNIYKEYIKAEK